MSTRLSDNSEQAVIERKYKPFKGKPDYRHTQKDKEFFITRYAFDVFGHDLRIRCYLWSGKKVDDVVVRNFRAVSANKLYEHICDSATNNGINRPLYDGLLRVYHDNDLELGFVVPILGKG